MSEFGNNIRRIAKTGDLERKIKEALEKVTQLEKSSIDARRGIAYYDPSSNSLGGIAAGTPGETKPDNGGNVYPGARTGNESNSRGAQISDKSRDGGDLLNGTDRPAIGEKVGTIELKDCDTGELIDVDFSNSNAEGENIFKPPAGWVTNSEPGTDTGYISTGGISWIWAGGDGTWSNNSTSAAEIAISLEPLAESFLSWSTDTPQEKADTEFALNPTTNSQPAIQFSVNRVGGGAPFNLSITGAFCGRAAGLSASQTTGCEEPIPSSTKWPDTKKSILSFSSEKGGFFSSQYDQEISNTWRRPQNEYTNGFKELNLCTLDGVEVTVEAAEDGGFYYYARDSFGDPDTTTYQIQHFDSDGAFLGTISEDRYNFLSD